jgi:hypothetical protein
MIRNSSIKLQKAFMLVCLLQKYQEAEAVGGCLHIVIEDGNYERHSIESCIEFSKENGDYWGEVIASLLLEFNDTEVEQIIERPFEIEGQMGITY